MKTQFVTCAMLATLTACGGTSTETVIELLTAEDVAGLVAVNVRANAAGTQLILDTDAGVLTADVDPALAEGTYVGGFTENPDDAALAYLSEGDASSAGLGLYFIDGGAGDDETGTAVAFTRTQDSILPQTGNATLNGHYVGALLSPTGETVMALGFVGDMELTANFADATMSGEMTNRTFISLASKDEYVASSVEDIQFEVTGITETGSFLGTTTGGALTLDANVGTTSPGTYRGLIAGEGGTEAVGAVQIDHDLDGDAFVELGSFAVGH